MHTNADFLSGANVYICIPKRKSHKDNGSSEKPDDAAKRPEPEIT